MPEEEMCCIWQLWEMAATSKLSVLLNHYLNKHVYLFWGSRLQNAFVDLFHYGFTFFWRRQRENAADLGWVCGICFKIGIYLQILQVGSVEANEYS